MTQPAMISATAPANGQTTPHDLFVLTDEQILEIEPEAQGMEVTDAVASGRAASPSEARNPSSSDSAGATEGSGSDFSSPSASRNDSMTGVANRDVEPPQWLADRMADPQAGGEAREFWNGIQQAQTDAKAYRDVFAKPEDARAAAERARTLDEIDAAFYGGAGNSPEQTSAARMQLAQRMMREDPAAFREMVFSGLRALEEANPSPQSPSQESRRVAPISVGQQPSKDSSVSGRNFGGPPLGMAEESVAAYQSFEKSANEELNRSVGGAIERALGQALPSLGTSEGRADAGTRHAASLQERLGAAIREDIEASLKSDRQLGEQIAQILSSRRFDDATRAQVVRLINDRAQQLVPIAAKRVINAWTQTTLAAHSAKTPKTAGAGERPDLVPARNASAAARPRAKESGRFSARSGRVDYARLSDEQILDL